jgi:hypothetical protein
MSQPLNIGVGLISKSQRKRVESRIWDLYLIEYAHMTRDNFIPWEDYLEKRTTPVIVKSKEEALEEIEETINKLKEQGLI